MVRAAHHPEPVEGQIPITEIPNLFRPMNLNIWTVSTVVSVFLSPIRSLTL